MFHHLRWPCPQISASHPDTQIKHVSGFSAVFCVGRVKRFLKWRYPVSPLGRAGRTLTLNSHSLFSSSVLLSLLISSSTHSLSLSLLLFGSLIHSLCSCTLCLSLYILCFHVSVLALCIICFAAKKLNNRVRLKRLYLACIMYTYTAAYLGGNILSSVTLLLKCNVYLHCEKFLACANTPGDKNNSHVRGVKYTAR